MTEIYWPGGKFSYPADDFPNLTYYDVENLDQAIGVLEILIGA